MLTGNYSIADIKRKADELGLKNNNKMPYAISTFHILFKNEFYCGYFYWKDENGNKKRYKGKHKAMISEQEFKKVQLIIGNKKFDTRSKSYEYAYRGLFNCGVCGCSITAERKHQAKCTHCKFKFSCLHRNDCPKCNTSIIEMNNPYITDTVYYHCTKGKGSCLQKCIREDEFEKQLTELFDTLKIPKTFYAFLINELKFHNKEINDKNETKKSNIKKRISELENRNKGLILMRADNDISQDDFVKLKEENTKRINEFSNQLKSFEDTENNWLEVINDYKNLPQDLMKSFQKSDNFTKRAILSKLVSNQRILDKKLYFTRTKTLSAIQSCYEYYSSRNGGFELKNRLIKQGDLGGFDSSNTVWRTGRDSNSQPPA